MQMVGADGGPRVAHPGFAIPRRPAGRRRGARLPAGVAPAPARGTKTWHVVRKKRAACRVERAASDVVFVSGRACRLRREVVDLFEAVGKLELEGIGSDLGIDHELGDRRYNLSRLAVPPRPVLNASAR